MAASSSPSIFNFLSFLVPSKPLPPPKTPPPNIISATQSQTSKTRNGGSGSVPLISTNETGSSLSTDISSVVCPSMAYSNTLFFRSAYNVQVIVEDNEPEEKLLNRFRREVMRAGVIQESKRRRYFENKQDKEKRKTREAAKRNRKRRPYSRIPVQDKQEGSKNKDNDEEDNWEIPVGDIPY